MLRLANVAVAGVEAPEQDEWLANRRAFDGERRHGIATRDGEIVGYFAVEATSEAFEGSCRVFLVLDWQRDVAEVAPRLFEAASLALSELGARRAWLREYAADTAIVDFVRERGFEVVEEYEHDGAMLVTIAKDV